MKATLFATFVALLLVGCGEADLSDPKVLEDTTADAVDLSKLQDRNGVYYLPNEETPFTGRAESFYENGQKRDEGNLKDGEPDGLWTYWYGDGQKEAEVNWKDGKLWTVVAWKPNGEKCPVTNIVEGNGVAVWYDEDGTEYFRESYKEGYAALSSKDGKRVDSNHSKTGSDDLDTIDHSGFNLDDELDRFREKVFSLTQKVKDSPSLESYEEWLRKVRLVEDNYSQKIIEILVERIDESSSELYYYKSKAKDMKNTPRQRQRYLSLAERYEVEVVAVCKNVKLRMEQSLKRMNDFLDLIEQDIEYLSDLMVRIREKRNLTQLSAIMKTTKIIQLNIESFLSDPENQERLAAERQKIEELYRPRSITEKLDQIAEEFDELLLEGSKTKE